MIIVRDSISSDLSAQILEVKRYIKLSGNLLEYKKDLCHRAYTYEQYDLQGSLVNFMGKTD